MHALFKMAASAGARKCCQLETVRTKANEAGYARLRRNQERFQVDDGCPVFLKKGLSDRLLYWATCALAVFGFAWSIQSGLSFIYPPEIVRSEEEEDDDNA